MLIDSHCHLDYFDADLDAVLARARAAGIAEMVTIGVRLSAAPWAIATAEAHPGVWATTGVHPHQAAERPVPDPAEIVALTHHPKIVGIGESGLDYFYDKAPRDIQAASFRAHIAAARTTQLPLVIHARDADDDVAAILEDETGRGAFPFLLHCFSSGERLAERALALGGFISFSGILTFPKSTELRDIAREIPGDRLLVETDAPYLAPVPYRGKRNEPAHVAHTAAVLADIRGVTPDAIAARTTANFRRLFRKTS